MQLFTPPIVGIEGLGSVEIRIADPAQYKQTYDFYKRIATKEILTLRDGGYSFDLGGAELRLLNQALTDGEQNRTIIYWRLLHNDETSLHDLYKELTDPGGNYKYIGVLERSADSFKPESPKWKPIRAVLRNEEGEEFGLIINPPFPRKKNLRSGRLILAALSPAIGVLAGMLLASVVPRGRSRR